MRILIWPKSDQGLHHSSKTSVYFKTYSKNSFIDTAIAIDPFLTGSVCARVGSPWSQKQWSIHRGAIWSDFVCIDYLIGFVFVNASQPI